MTRTPWALGPIAWGLAGSSICPKTQPAFEFESSSAVAQAPPPPPLPIGERRLGGQRRRSGGQNGADGSGRVR